METVEVKAAPYIEKFTEVCGDHDYDTEDFLSTIRRFDVEAPVHRKLIDLRITMDDVGQIRTYAQFAEGGIRDANDFESWLKQGNCPPPRPPQAKSGTETATSTSGSPTVDRSSGSSGGGNNLKLLAVAGGFGAIAGVCWLASAILVADDATGVGAVDDPALAATVPAATASTAVAVDAGVKLAAGILLWMGVQTAEEPSDKLQG